MITHQSYTDSLTGSKNVEQKRTPNTKSQAERKSCGERGAVARDLEHQSVGEVVSGGLRNHGTSL